MKKKLLYFFFLVSPSLCIAQKQGNIWYFGKQSGLDFSSGVPVTLSNGQTGTDIPITDVQEGTSCISDSSGNILFYTGGKTIWNKNHSPMPNGTGLLGGTSASQSSIVIPLPGSDSIFYVFTADDFQGYSNPPQKGYRYSVVNTCLDSGNGDIISGQKNILLCDSSTEKLAACEDASGTGYWIIGHKMFSDEFHAWHLASTGITDAVVSSIGTIHGWRSSSSWVVSSAQGEMKFNSAGTKLAVAIGNFDPAYLDLYDFDKATGIISNFCHIVIDSVLQKRTYGTAFSLDGTKMYVTAAAGLGGRRIYQFDITAGSCSSIIASRFQVAQLTPSGLMSGMQLAPDGKIYLVCNTSSDLGCINFPNLSGLSSGFDSSVIIVSGTVPYELPNFIAGYKYHNGIAHCSTTDGIAEQEQNTDIVLFPNPSSGYFTIQTNTSKVTSLEIYNLLGAKVYSASLSSSNSIKVDISKEPEGVYFVRVRTQKGTLSQKVVLAK